MGNRVHFEAGAAIEFAIVGANGDVTWHPGKVRMVYTADQFRKEVVPLYTEESEVALIDARDDDVDATWYVWPEQLRAQFVLDLSDPREVETWLST